MECPPPTLTSPTHITDNPDTKPTRSPPSPRPQEPDPKKLKMSTTTTSDDEEATAAATNAAKTPRYKRRKVAIFFAYLGVGYQGMQKNPGAKTIEGDLEEALYLSNAVPEQDRNSPKRYDWARSARTDKGVSAVGQVVSGRFYVDPPGFIDRLNSNLSPQIRIFGYKRVTASFNAKKFCDRRRYVYLIPVFALDPSAHRDRGSVLASLGSDQEFVKCLECSERGRKVGGLMGKRTYELRGTNFEVSISSNTNESMVESEIGEKFRVLPGNAGCDNLISEPRNEVSLSINEEIKVLTENAGVDNSNSELKTEISISINNNEVTEIEVENNRVVPNEAEAADLNSESLDDTNVSFGEEKANEKENTEEGSGKGNGFCYGEKERERFNKILNSYEGTYNFHNFTTRTKAVDPAAQRYIISFNANTTVTVEGMEFVKCEVVGQSFMLHQIRKMIGLAVAIFRGCAPESLLERALQKDVNINVPTAPEVGLYLDECFFSSYNQKWGDSHEELSMKGYEQEAEDFKMKHIYTHIASTEHKEGVVGLWLHSLNHRNYPDLGPAENNGNTSNGISADTELAESISKKLTTYADYLRFRVVCHSWRASVPKTPHHLPPQLPWLMLPQSQPNQSHRAFFNLSNSRVHFLHLPEASHRKCRCGSSHGWLVILDETPSVLLVNPLTRARRHLPPSPPSPTLFDLITLKLAENTPSDPRLVTSTRAA
ncbi:hypothetical protein DVH24_013054 [Malus domestica]|uniref:Uncharacterized protein n=1 Tax=Malus domestica TaxID=3750 RepID=A0A498HRJ1_MALDO|nr:hypothetical protein DVH24_013054 [Malus domestica]